ncbi:unnamed protein product [Brachionus calyciflorus]|uniref:FLYWCH-type domain-containing protein n=1 Tax=Brachionus calyciflorus TaxID=104777 RepID=A0A813WUA5_9BILA|nr:unnamed protein product [Brachionus calyciflorus]
MSEFTLIPTSRGGHYLFYEHQLYYKVKPKNSLTDITIWRCQSNNHENHEKVKQTETNDYFCVLLNVIQ